MDQPSPQAPTPVTPTPVPSPTTNKRSAWHLNPWRLFIGLLVIMFGLSLLAQQFGWNWVAPEAVWRLWPVFIILIGISMMIRGRMAGTIVGLMVAVAAVGLVILGSVGSWNTTATHTQTIAVERETTATAGKLTLSLGAAKITVHGGATDLVSGTYETNDQDLRVATVTTGLTQSVTFDRQSVNGWMFMHRWKNDLDLRLNSELPLELNVDSGAADLNLDLTNVKVTAIDINAGASSIDLTLDDLVDRNRVTIDSGAASMNLRLPRGVGVHANIDGGASSKTLPSELKKLSDHVYETDGFGAATKQIDLSVDAGASSLKIEWI